MFTYVLIYIADMRTMGVTSERIKIANSNDMPTLREFRLFGLRCSSWHSRQANDAVASERSIFSENQGYKSFSRVTVNPYVPIFRDLDARGGRNLRTDTQTHRHTHARRRLIIQVITKPWINNNTT